MDMIPNNSWIWILQVTPNIFMVKYNVNTLVWQLTTPFFYLILRAYTCLWIYKLWLFNWKKMLIWSLFFIFLSLSILSCEELILWFLHLLFSCSQLLVIQLLKIIFLIFTKRIQLTNMINILSFETLIHVTVINNSFNITLEARIW